MLFEMHCHTAEFSPCSEAAALDLVRQVCHRGAQGIVITDHHYLWPEDDLAALRQAAGVPREPRRVREPVPAPQPGWNEWRLNLGSQTACRLRAAPPPDANSARPLILVRDNLNYYVKSEAVRVLADFDIDVLQHFRADHEVELAAPRRLAAVALAMPALQRLDPQPLERGRKRSARERRPRHTESPGGAIHSGHELGFESHLDGAHVDVSSYGNS